MSNATDYLKNLQTINRSFKRISKHKIMLCDKSVKEDNTIVKNIPHVDMDKVSPEDVPSQSEHSDIPTDKKDKKDTIGKQAKKKCLIRGCKTKHHAKGYCKKHYRSMKDSPVKTCSVEGCTDKHHAKGYCRKHYENKPAKVSAKKPVKQMIVEEVSVNKKPMKTAIRTCSIEGCTDKHHGKGYCRKHYGQFCEKKNQKSAVKSEVVISAEPIVEVPTKVIETIKPAEQTAEAPVVETLVEVLHKNYGVPDEAFVEKVRKSIANKDAEGKKEVKESRYSAPIFTEPEENLTERQREDLKAHYAAVKRLDNLAKNPRTLTSFLWDLTSH